MRYRHNPDLDIEAIRQQIRQLEFDRNNLERDIDTLGVNRFTEPKITAMWSQVRDLEQKIQEQQALLDQALEARAVAAGFPAGTQLDLFAKANPNPRRSTAMAAAKDFFRMTREQLIRSSAAGAKAELRRRGRDAQGNRIGGKKAKASASTKSRVSTRAKKAKSKARRSSKK